ncbi:hypothetical protein ACWEO4_36100 [Streptomyces sp. NPDC004393]
MRVSSLVAALGVAAAALLGGATGASAATNAPSVVAHATHDRGHDHDGYGRGDHEGRWGDHRWGGHEGRWGGHRWGGHEGRWGGHEGRWGGHRWGGHEGRWGGHRWGGHEGRWGDDRYDHR